MYLPKEAYLDGASGFQHILALHLYFQLKSSEVERSNELPHVTHNESVIQARLNQGVSFVGVSKNK